MNELKFLVGERKRGGGGQFSDGWIIGELNWWIVFVVWFSDERRLAVFPVGTIVRDPHHRKSSSRRKQGLNLRRTWVQAWLNEVV